MKSAAAKEAIGGMLDGQVALMQSDSVPEMGGPPSTRTRGGGRVVARVVAGVVARVKAKIPKPRIPTLKLPNTCKRTSNCFSESNIMQLVSLEVLSSY